MPTFEVEATVTSTVDVDFEVFCGGCGDGLCSESEGGNTAKRRFPFVTVNPCKRCIEKAVDEAIERLDK